MSAKLGNASLTLNDTIENWVMDLLSDAGTSLSTLRLYNGTTTSLMTVLRNGKVGFGIDNPNSTVHAATSMAVTRIGSAPHIVLCGAGGGTLSSPTATLADGGIGKISGNTYDGTNWVASADITMYASENATSGSRGGYITFNTIPTGSATLAEQMRLDPSGVLLLGTTTSRRVGGAVRSIQVEKTGQASISLTRSSANTIGPNVVLGKTRGSSVGSSTAVAASDELGTIHFAGADGTNLETNSVNIQAFAEGTISTGVVPGRLSISTMNSSGSMVERMRIDSAGTVSTYGLNYNSGTYSWGGSLALAHSDVVANKQALLTLPGGGYVGDVFVVTSRTANDGSSNNRAAYKFRIARTGGATGTYAQFFVELAEEDTNMAVSYQWYFDTTTGNAYLRFGQTGNSYGWSVETRFGGAANANITPTLVVDSGTAPTGTAISPNRVIGNANTPGTMAFSTSGVERARIDSSGNFGIGTTSPAAILHVAGSSARLQNSASSDTAFSVMNAVGSTVVGTDAASSYILAGNSRSLQFYTAGSSRVAIDTSGNVGIGTNTPAVGARLHAVTPASTACIFRAESSSYGYMDVGQSATGAFLFARSSDANYGSLYFGTAGVERLRIDTSGNAGLGVTPSAWGSYKAFDIGAAGNGLYGISSEIGLTSNAYFNSGWKYAASSIMPTRYASGGGYHQWYTAASGTAGGSFTWSPLMSLDLNGYLTLNGSARLLIQPSASVNNALLQFNNGAGNGYVGLDSASGALDVPYSLVLWHTGAYPIVMGTNNAERMRIDATGNVSIGTTGTTDRFTVQSPLTGTTTGSNTVARFQTSGSGYDAHIALGDAVNASARLGYLSGAMYMWTNGAERMRIDSNGNFGFGTTSPVNNGRTITIYNPALNGAACLYLQNGSSGSASTDGVAFQIFNLDGYMWNYEAGRLIFGTSNAERMRIETNGDVGIGTNSPEATLHVTSGGNSGSISICGTSNPGTIMMGNKDSGGTSGPVIFQVANRGLNIAHGTSFTGTGGTITSRLYIDNAGNVGISTTTPSAQLHLNGSAAGAEAFRITPTGSNSRFSIIGRSDGGGFDINVAQNTDGSANKILTIQTGGTERMRIDSFGNLGIGATSIGERLHVQATGNDASLRLQASTGKSWNVTAGGGGNYTSGVFAIRNVTDALTGLTISPAGVISDGAGNELGWKNIPPTTNTWTRGGANVITANATVGTANAGDTYSVYNNSSVNVTLTPSGVTMYLGGTNTSGARTLLPHGFATIWFLNSTTCVINGNVT